MRDENGLEKCVACGLCAVACPADAIYLEAAENDGSVQAGPRYAKVYQIHKTRCIFCGYCEEACPVSAIFMGKDYELAVYSNKDFIWDKQTCSFRPRPPPSQSMRFGALGDIHGDFAACAASCGSIPSAVLALRRRRRGCRGALRAVRRAALLDQGQQRELRRDRLGRSASRSSITFPTVRCGPIGRRSASPALAARFAPTCTRRRQPSCRIRRRAPRRRPSCADQAPSLRARRGRGLQGGCEDVDVFLTHEAPRPFARGPRQRRGEDADQRSPRRDEAAAAPVRAPPSVHARWSVQGVRSVWPRSRLEVIPPRSSRRRWSTMYVS